MLGDYTFSIKHNIYKKYMRRHLARSISVYLPSGYATEACWRLSLTGMGSGPRNACDAVGLTIDHFEKAMGICDAIATTSNLAYKVPVRQCLLEY